MADRTAPSPTKSLAHCTNRRKRWANALPNVAKEWAQRTDARGLPGTRLVKAYMDELRKLPGADKEIARSWDRE